MDLVLLDEVLGPLLMSYLNFPDVQRLRMTSQMYSRLTTLSSRHLIYWEYLHNKQILKYMKKRGYENEEMKKTYDKAIDPNCDGYAQSRIMIGINQQSTPVNAGGYLAGAWRKWLEMKYTGEGEHGWQLSNMTYAEITTKLNSTMVLDKLEDTGKRKRDEALIQNCDAQYGCRNTRMSHYFFETGTDTYLCSSCLDSPGMEVAKMALLWENMNDCDEWWFGETSYYTDNE